MLQNKLQGHWPFEDFWSFFIMYGHGDHLGHVIQTAWIKTFFLPTQLGSWILASIGPVISEKEMLEHDDELQNRRSKNDHYLQQFNVFIWSFGLLTIPNIIRYTHIVSEKFSVYAFSHIHCNSITNLSWPYHKLGQGQPWVIIFISLDGLQTQL